MPDRVPHIFKFDKGGYTPTQPRAGGLNDTIYDGQNVWVWGNGLLESAKGLASSSSDGGANPLMNVGSTYGGVTGGGTVVRAFGVEWAAGTGTALEGTTALGTVSSNLRLSTSFAASSLVNAGIAQPSAPTLADSGVVGKNDGSYSVALTAIRSATGAESTRSLPSLPITVSGHKITVNFPAVPSGADKWGIYVTFRGFGTTGPWFHHSDVNTGGGSVQIDWYNGELGDEAPIDHDVPPTCTHCFAVNSVMVAAGTFGQSGLSPSIPGSPEAFPPDFTVFLPGGGAITSCKATGFEGTVLVATARSLTAVIGTNNADVSPIMVRQIWPTTGFLTGNAWCTVEGEIYGFSGQRGPVRTRGDGPPDSTFALDVIKKFADAGFTGSNTVVGYDPTTDSIVFASGTIALCYSRTNGWWHCPMTLPGSAVTSVTVGGQLFIDCGSNTLNSFEGGSGTSWFVIPAFTDFGQPEFNHTLVRFRCTSNASMTADLLADNDTSTSLQTIAVTAPFSTWIHLNLRNKKNASIKVSGSGSAQSIYELQLQAIPHMVTT